MDDISTSSLYSEDLAFAPASKRTWFLLLGLCCVLSVVGQDKRAEKRLRKAGGTEYYHSMKERKWEKVRAVTYIHYADSVFPNDELLRLKNIESVNVWGRTWKRDHKYTSLPPIRLRIDTVKLKQLPHLKYVSLWRFDLSVPPEGFSALTGLEGLDMSACHLDSLPKDIGRMRNLRALVLRLNYLKQLPPGIADLDSLRSIDLVNNHFREVPIVLAGCASLERIHLDNGETGHGMHDGYELEYSGPAYDWPFPLCANHIMWRQSKPGLSALLNLPHLDYIRLHAQGCKQQKIAQAEFGSGKIRFRKPLECPDRWFGRAMAGRSREPLPNDPEQRNCTCARMKY